MQTMWSCYLQLFRECLLQWRANNFSLRYNGVECSLGHASLHTQLPFRCCHSFPGYPARHKVQDAAQHKCACNKLPDKSKTTAQVTPESVLTSTGDLASARGSISYSSHIPHVPTTKKSVGCNSAQPSSESRQQDGEASYYS